jgi:hypothetical protein
MKRLLLMLAMVAASFEVIAQDSLSLPLLENRVGIQKVMALDSTLKSDLYHRAKLYIAEEFRSSKDVIQLDDAEQGTILIKAKTKASFFNVMAQAEIDVWFTLKLDLKDGRYRYALSDILLTTNRTPAEDYWKMPKMNKNLRKSVGESLRSLAASLETAMAKSPKGDKW